MKPTQILKLVRALVASGVTSFEGCGVKFSVAPAAVVPDESWAKFAAGTVPQGTAVSLSSEPPPHHDVLAQLIGKARPVTRAE